MKLAESISIRVFAKPEDDAGKIKEGLLNLVGLDISDIEKEKIKLTETSAVGFDRTIKIFEIFLQKERHTTAFLKKLNARLNEETKEMILKQAESRLDDNLNFFLRFDKDKWLNEEKLRLVEHGNCYHIRISVAAFPHKRDVALEVVGKIFKLSPENE